MELLFPKRYNRFLDINKKSYRCVWVAANVLLVLTVISYLIACVIYMRMPKMNVHSLYLEPHINIGRAIIASIFLLAMAGVGI